MISYELAKALKDAGLKWEPELLDYFTFCAENIDGIEPFILCVMTNQEDVDGATRLLRDKQDPADVLWLPRLDQLLAEIDKTYEFTLHSGGYIVLRKKFSGIASDVPFHGDNLENTAGQALLWILKEAQL